MAPSTLSLNNLPDEIILSIFENLTYDELKCNVPLVCKRFNEILQKISDSSSSPIDIILFRDSPRQPPIIGHQACILNPCVDLIRYSYSENIDDVLVRNDRSWNYRPFIESPVRNENVCTPAVTRVIIVAERDGYNEPPIEVNGSGIGGAVTVLDLMEAVVHAVKTVWKMEHIWSRGYYWDGLERTEIIDGVLHAVDGWNI